MEPDPTADRMPSSPETGGAPRRARLIPGGPMLIEGPVELTLPSGEVVCSQRFMVAVCMCRRSARYPFCDTSHRRIGRTRT